MKASDKGLPGLKRDLKAGAPGRLYVFHGQESYLRDFYLGKLKACLVTPDFEGFNYILLEARGLTADRLFDAVDSLPVFAPRKLVVVRDLDLRQPPGELKPVLEKIVADLPESVCLVFLFDTMDFKQDARLKLHKLLAKEGQIVDFAPQGNADLIPWIARHFKAQDRQIDRRLCEYMLFQCGSLMSNLKNEIDKTAAYSRGRQITKEDIDAVVTPVLDAVMYQMTNAMADRAWDKAMGILLTLREMKEEPVVLLAAMGRNLRGMYAARLARQSGRSAHDVMRLMGYQSLYPVERLMQAAQKRSLPWCRRAVSLCAEADLFLKSGRGDRGRVLEWIVAKLEEDVYV